jgi:hypothetical protein
MPAAQEEPTMHAPVCLKNGTEEHPALVQSTMMHLRELLHKSPMAAFELCYLCRDKTHVPFGNSGEKLLGTGLVDNQDGRWHVHNSIRNVVLSACESDGLDLTIGSPLAEK